ncbi:MAG: efflux RND transporter periplasmic adaptor subunit [Desulfocucumaceae bacterium]
MKRNKKLFLGVGVVVVLAVAAWALKGGGIQVETVQVQQGDITRIVAETGYVQPSANHELYATQAARVDQVPVKTGQKVSRGQMLAVLENLDLAVQINDTRMQLSQVNATAAAARAALQKAGLEVRSAEENYSRTQELFRTEAISRVEYEKALLQVETLRQGLKEQSFQLESSLSQVDGLGRTLEQLSAKERQLQITSPAEGVVLSLPVQPGQVLSPGSLLATVAAEDSLEIRADLLSDDLSEVSEGQKVNVTAPVLGSRSLTGQVKQIYPRAEEKMSALGVAQRRVPVIISLDEIANLKPGFEVKVSVETMTRHNVLLAPLEAIRTRADGQKEVMVVVNKLVARRTVSTGISDREKVEITGGLEAGDVLIRDGSQDLPDKAKVKP